MGTTRDAWRRIDAWLVREALGVAGSLCGPISLPVGSEAPPASLLEVLAVHDGQRGEEPLFECFTLVSWHECVERRRSMAKLRLELEDDYAGEYWSPTWFPVLDDRSGSLLCLDTRTEQVVSFWHDAPERQIVAASLEALFREMADAMETGHCVVDDVGVSLRDGDHPLSNKIHGEDPTDGSAGSEPME